MPQASIPVVVNRTGGTAASLGDSLGDKLREAFAAAGVAIDLHLVDGEQVDRTIANLAGAPLVVVGGGDGTLGHAAAILAKVGTAMGILPLGTRNHLARQLGLPLDLAEAAKVIAAGHRQRMDLGRIGERVFINNASLGLYARLVRDRDALRAPKWLASVPAAWHVLRHLRAHPLVLEIDGESHALDTPLLFIGNGAYLLEGGKLGQRESLSDGVLAFYAVAARNGWQLVAMALRVLTGRADPERDFAALKLGRKARITGRPTMDVACDGEVARMALPLELESLPGALEVIVP